MLNLKRKVLTLLSGSILIMGLTGTIAAEQQKIDEIINDIKAKTETMRMLEGKTDDLSRRQFETIRKAIENQKTKLVQLRPVKEQQIEYIEPDIRVKRGRTQKELARIEMPFENKLDMGLTGTIAAEQQKIDEIIKDIEDKTETMIMLEGKTDDLSRTQLAAIRQEIENQERKLDQLRPIKEEQIEYIEPEITLKREKFQKELPIKKMPFEDKLDKEYIEFIYNLPEFSKYKKYINSNEYIDPKNFFDLISTGNNVAIEDFDKTTFPLGKYESNSMPWFTADIRNSCEFKKNMFPDDGWKIHITAVPKSAKKIAEIVLPILRKSSNIKLEVGQESCNVPYKILTSIPQMRTLFYVHAKTKLKENEKGASGETQAGKYIVIYPGNLRVARILATEIDNALQNEKERGNLDDSDFTPLIGDARVGYSGGVYVRYGEFFPDNKYSNDGKTMLGGMVKYTDPCWNHGLGNKMLPTAMASTKICQPKLEKEPEAEKDNRYFPWPDYMNQNRWRSTPNPFGDLPLVFKGKTWDQRPRTWEDKGA